MRCVQWWTTRFKAFDCNARSIKLCVRLEQSETAANEKLAGRKLLS